MALADKARDALRHTNSIEAIFSSVEPPRPSGGHDTPNPPAPPVARSEARSGQNKPAAYVSDPESIAKRYYVEQKQGERRYFEDYQRKNLVMRATDTSISSKR
jgi:hypothetical protein